MQPNNLPDNQPQTFVSPPTPPSQPNYNSAPTNPEDPGKTLGIVGIVLAFVFALAGLIVSIISIRKSKSAGYPGTLGVVGIVINIFIIIFFAIVGGAIIITATNSIKQKARETVQSAEERSMRDEPNSTYFSKPSDSNSSLNEPVAGGATNLNDLGTVTDSLFQKDILSYIKSLNMMRGIENPSVSVNSITSTKLSDREYVEIWNTDVNGTKFTYEVKIRVLDDGSVEFSVRQQGGA